MILDFLAQQAASASATQPLSTLDLLLMVALPAVAALAGSIGKKIGEYLATTAPAWIDAQLRAKKHDELIPVVDALVKGIQEGCHEATIAAVQAAAKANGSDDHPIVAQLGATP